MQIIRGHYLKMLIDIHVHSDNSSCSVMPASEIVARARSLGLDGVCITDHDTTAVLSQIQEGFQPDGLLVLVGMEYSTDEGDFLVYGDVESLVPGMDGRALLTSVIETGGAVVAAHPFRGWRPSDTGLFQSYPPSAIEVVNGRNTEAEDAQALELACHLALAHVSGSDAHRFDELGRFPTRFTCPISDRVDLVNALRQGMCRPGVLRSAALASAS
ncbi:PHP-associated domain-containing protein [Pseudodesulfovibrio piezophilus]|uniref:PHP domain protein n=1 Tax=Pseudodesulfovibrio piezophilus (strain DSM 21447 / JCM 15486 / C1TLV30) TaxID=1322246 RepID=M1WUA6_PSEP2|nr:PHP domain-containing protein [Pseudodesulfovibrio piezophilus]CCH50452.1 PHP domain protein [Pseudodesulfovibrio piezophilus C1TLV30]